MSGSSSIASPARIWRVFYTTPRAEKKCEERLQQRRVEVFLPKCVVVRQWKDRKKKVVEPLFKNYLFAQVDEHERLRVLRTPGIVRCVSFGGNPATVSEAEIEQLKIAQNDPKRLLVIDYPLPKLGARVTVTEGPLRGLCGEVMQHRSQTHIILRVTAIRQAVRVNVPAAWVQTDRSVPAA
ncbi:MAG: UpxY family transcription antiterminator [Rhodothermales bacterium]